MEDRAFVSIVMPVFNAEAFLEEAINSILSQTFSDFEFIIINDGSKDRSGFIVKRFEDKRIRYIDLKENTGLANVLNLGLNEANGKYIVRMDGDDIATPDRLQKQVEFMEKHSDVGVCGSLAKIIGGKIMNQYMPSSMLAASLLLDNVLVHPTVIMRKSIIDKHGLCYEGFVEDYRLWVKFAVVSKLAVIPEILLHYRLSEGQFSVRCKPDQLKDANKVRKELFEEILSRSLNIDEEVIVYKEVDKSNLTLKALVTFCDVVMHSNRKYSSEVLNKVMKKLVKRNIWFIKLSSNDIFSIMTSRYLSLREKFSTLKLTLVN